MTSHDVYHKVELRRKELGFRLRADELESNSEKFTILIAYLGRIANSLNPQAKTTATQLTNELLAVITFCIDWVLHDEIISHEFEKITSHEVFLKAEYVRKQAGFRERNRLKSRSRRLSILMEELGKIANHINHQAKYDKYYLMKKDLTILTAVFIDWVLAESYNVEGERRTKYETPENPA